MATIARTSPSRPSAFAVCRRRNFALHWTAEFISTVGSGLTTIAASLLVYRETGSAFSVGLMLMATALPSLFLGLIAGVFVDRLDRQRMMIAAELIRALLVASIPMLLPFGVAWLYAADFHPHMCAWRMGRLRRIWVGIWEGHPSPSPSHPIQMKRVGMTKHTFTAYLPQDRRLALSRGVTLPERAEGAALFADISGFTPLTEALTRALGPRRGVEELTAQIDRVYDALIAEVDRFGGSVVSFAGDAIMCWFEDRVMGVGGWGSEENSPCASSLFWTAC
jgi:MFS family permease